MLENISFVLIAKNEQFGIQKSLEVLSNTSLHNSEIILVDSGSEDDTGKFMEEFKIKNSNSNHIIITGDLNASIARNAGLALATRDFCFFIDGDTEIFIDFVIESLKVFEENCNCVAVAGDLTDYFYDENFSKLIDVVPNRFSIDKVCSDKGFGGNVIVKTKIAKKLKWDPDFKIHEDFDFSLRLREYGSVLLIPSNMGIHHTRYDTKNAYKILRTRNPKYFGHLIRRHFSKNFRYLIKINRGHWIGISFYFAVIILVLFDEFLFENSYSVILFLLIFDFFKAAFKNFPSSIFDWFVVRVAYPIFIFYGLFFD